jgi:hypothetical protein
LLTNQPGSGVLRVLQASSTDSVTIRTGKGTHEYQIAGVVFEAQ